MAQQGIVSRQCGSLVKSADSAADYLPSVCKGPLGTSTKEIGPGSVILLFRRSRVCSVRKIRFYDLA